jgi:hypothetical protein
MTFPLGDCGAILFHMNLPAIRKYNDNNTQERSVMMVNLTYHPACFKEGPDS